MAEGVRAVEALVESPIEIAGVLISDAYDRGMRGSQLISELERRAETDGFAIQYVSEEDFLSAASTEAPQGVLAIGRVPAVSFRNLQVGDGFRLLVLDGVQDPGNVGTILRTAAGFGIDATVVLKGSVDIWNAKVVRAAMGAHFVHPAFHAEADELDEFLKRFNIPLWVASAEGEPIVIRSSESSVAPVALVVGNEGAGVSPELADMGSRAVGIPIRQVDSLNVAVATGILLYAIRKPEQFP